jgi:hypothetical protein
MTDLKFLSQQYKPEFKKIFYRQFHVEILKKKQEAVGFHQVYP